MPAAPGRTAFESTFDSAAGRLTVAQAKLNAFVEAPATTLTVGSSGVELSELLKKGGVTLGRTGAVVALLLPPIGGVPTTIEAASVPGDDDYYFVATTTNNLWQQVVLQAIGRVMGLGDESELDGAEFLAPTSRKEVPYINLQYFDALPASNRNKALKWSPYLSVADRIRPPVVHPKANPATADHDIDAVPLTPTGIEYWEGGGGYRTKVYRSAKDCLMRRRIGDGRLPVSARPVPFCHVCNNHLKSFLF